MFVLLFVLMCCCQKRCDFLEDNVIKKTYFLLYEILQKTSKMESDREDFWGIHNKNNKNKNRHFSIKYLLKGIFN